MMSRGASRRLRTGADGDGRDCAVGEEAQEYAGDGALLAQLRPQMFGAVDTVDDCAAVCQRKLAVEGGHARVEDRIRCAKDSGLGRLPSRELAINTAWLELVLVAADLTARLQTTVLADQPDLAKAEPKALRHRLLHTAARITHGGRRVFLNLARTSPWTTATINAFTRLRLVPVPT